MAKQTINIGSTANDKSGDPLRTAFNKVNSNFNELYALVGGTVADLTEIAQDYAAPLLNHNSHTGISFSYDDVNNKLIAIVPSPFPSQTGNAGKFLTTNGLATVWDVIKTDRIEDVSANLKIQASTNKIIASQNLLLELYNGTQLKEETNSSVFVGITDGNVVFRTKTATNITRNWELTSTGTFSAPTSSKISFTNTGTIESVLGNLTINSANYVYIDSIGAGQLMIGTASGVGNIILGSKTNGTDINVNGDLLLHAGTSITFPDGTSQTTAFAGGGLTASSSDTFTNKTINIQSGQGNTFQIQGNSISSYSGSGAVLLLQSMPTLNAFNIGNSSNLTVDGGTGSYYWSGPAGVAGAGIDKAGVYRSSSSATNSLFTFAANGAGTMSAAVEGSLFVGTARPSNNGGLNTDYSGWLVVQSGGKFGGDLNTRGALIFDDAATGAVVFADGTRQTTAWDTGYLSFTKAAVKGTSGYTYTFNTDGYFTGSTSSESTGYFFVTYNSTNLNIAAGWTVVGANCDTTVSSTVYPVAGYPGVIRVNLTAPASSTTGFYPVVVTSPDRNKVQLQPNPTSNEKYTFTASGLTFPDNSSQNTAWTGIPGPYANDSAAGTAGVSVGKPYYQPSGQVFVRLV